MKFVFDINNLGHLPASSPAHHSGTLNRYMVGRDTGASRMAIWEGTVEAGGGADAHLHEDMEQAFLVLEGEAIFKFPDEDVRVGAGELVFIPAKLPHQIVSCGECQLRTLVFNAPAPEPKNTWKPLDTDGDPVA